MTAQALFHISSAALIEPMKLLQVRCAHGQDEYVFSNIGCRLGSLARLLWHEKLDAVPVTQLWRVGGNLHVAMALGGQRARGGL